MKKLNIHAALAAAIGLTGAHCASAQEAAFAPSYYAHEQAPQANATFTPAITKQVRIAPAAKLIALGAMDEQALFTKLASAPMAGAHQVGTARASAATGTAKATAQNLQWQALPSGAHAAALQYQSDNAFALRLGLLVDALPATAIVRVYAPGQADAAIEISGAHIQETLALNARNSVGAAGLTPEQINTYWLPTLAGDAAVLEIEVPAGLDPAGVQVAMPTLSHFFESPELALAQMEKLERIGMSEGCNYDATCATEISEVRKSVGRMLMTVDGNSGYCTGTLVADQARSGTPYFITAEHCISTQPVASSLETDWRFHTETCTPDSGVSKEHNRLFGIEAGARLVYSERRFDTTLLVLNALPRGNVLFSGWWASRELNQSVYGISHPRGDLQKVSYGRISSYAVCTPFNADGLTSCRPGTADYSDFFNVNYSYGTTEPGSSGSGLFARHADGNHYLIGVLSSGSASCSMRDGSSVYGRFDMAYADGLKYFLGEKNSTYPSLRPIYRFYNHASDSHFYTQSPEQRDIVIRNMPGFTYEHEQFMAYTYQAPGTVPVHRFYNHVVGSHFYTANEAEAQTMRTQFADSHVYEGVAWFARTTPGDGTSPVMRYFNTHRGTYFYTMIPEQQRIIELSMPYFRKDGAAYYAWPMTSQ